MEGEGDGNGRAEGGIVIRMVVEEGWRKLKGGGRDRDEDGGGGRMAAEA